MERADDVPTPVPTRVAQLLKGLLALLSVMAVASTIVGLKAAWGANAALPALGFAAVLVLLMLVGDRVRCITASSGDGQLRFDLIQRAEKRKDAAAVLTEQGGSTGRPRAGSPGP